MTAEQEKRIICKTTQEVNILPVYFPAPVFVYLDVAIPLSMILTAGSGHNFLWNNYIQVKFNLDYAQNQFNDNLFEFYPRYHFWLSHTLGLRSTNLDNRLLKLETDSIIARTIAWINDKYYLWFFLNERLIPNTALYNKKDLLHPIFIFGYDLKQQVFKMLNYNAKGEFAIIDLAFSDFENVFYSDTNQDLISKHKEKINQPPTPYWIYFFQIFNTEYVLNQFQIGKQLGEYLKGENSSLNDGNYYVADYNSVWGMEIYKALREYLAANTDNPLDYRTFHGLWEHKKLMSGRLKVLQSNQLLKAHADFAADYDKVVNLSNTARLMCMKYNKRKDLTLKEELSNVFLDLYSVEKQILSDVLAALD